VLSPEPMRHLSLVVMTDDLEAVTRAIASIGVLHLLDIRRMEEGIGAVRPYNVSDELTRFERLAHALDGVAEFLSLRRTDVEETGDAEERVDPLTLETRVQAITTAVEELRQRLVQARNDVAQLQNLLRTLQALAPLGLPVEHMRQLRYVHLTSGLLPARNLLRLQESMARIVSVILPAGEASANGRVLITALCLRRDRDVLDRALRSAQFEPLEVPAHLTGTPAEGTVQVSEQIVARQEVVVALEQERRALAERVGAEIAALRTRIARERLLAEARGLMGHSERTALLSGWVPAVLTKALGQTIHKAVGSRSVLQWSAPDEMESVRSGHVPVPILLHNPVLIRPFERLLRAYGLPRYGEIEPTAVVALGFLTMFGFMFGDVGQGAVLFAAGFFMYRRMFRYRDYSIILMECGVSAALFGVLYGSVFGVERWLPALWLRPLDDMATLMKTAVGFGVAFLSLGLTLNMVNAVRRGDRAALWERNGLLAALAYWIAVGVLIRLVSATSGAMTLRTAGVWLAVPLTLIFLKEPARLIVKGLRTHEWPDASEAFALTVQSLVEVLDTVVSAISNTATFIRLAAFALSHAGLFLATFSVADAVAGMAGGSVAAVLVIVLGNLVIIALEGLIVSVQSVRLEYYEFFSKFYSGGGEAYRPLHLASAQSRP